MAPSATTARPVPHRSAEGWARRGFTGVKAKIGYPTVGEDVAVIRAMRKAVGDGVAIMVDYNQCLTPAEAVQRLRVLDDEGLTWVEEPTLAHDYRRARAGRARGENADSVRRELVGRHATCSMRSTRRRRTTDAGRHEDRRRHGLAARGGHRGSAHGIRVSNHLWPEISAQLLSVTPTAHWLEYADWWNPIIAEPLEIEKGLTSTGSRQRNRRRVERECSQPVPGVMAPD